MANVLKAAHDCSDMPAFDVDPSSKAVNCHHNYVKLETHFGKEVFLTRKGAVSYLLCTRGGCGERASRTGLKCPPPPAPTSR